MAHPTQFARSAAVFLTIAAMIGATAAHTTSVFTGPFRLYFVTGSVEFDPDTIESMSHVKPWLDSVQNKGIIIIGHADRTGAARMNEQLSVRRAIAVADWLVSDGIAATRICVDALGERQAHVPTRDGVAEPRNRRVEISLLYTSLSREQPAAVPTRFRNCTAT